MGVSLPDSKGNGKLERFVVGSGFGVHHKTKAPKTIPRWTFVSSSRLCSSLVASGANPLHRVQTMLFRLPTPKDSRANRRTLLNKSPARGDLRQPSTRLQFNHQIGRSLPAACDATGTDSVMRRRERGRNMGEAKLMCSWPSSPPETEYGALSPFMGFVFCGENIYID